jgi:hypothetical protein
MSTFGPTYDARVDGPRLHRQMDMIRDIMLSASELNTWLTLREIEAMTHYPQASISAQLRHLRKRQFGSYIVEKRPRGNRKEGLFEYRVRKADTVPPIQERMF